jgi:hypothetical protein
MSEIFVNAYATFKARTKKGSVSGTYVGHSRPGNSRNINAMKRHALWNAKYRFIYDNSLGSDSDIQLLKVRYETIDVYKYSEKKGFNSSRR